MRPKFLEKCALRPYKNLCQPAKTLAAKIKWKLYPEKTRFWIYLLFLISQAVPSSLFFKIFSDIFLHSGRIWYICWLWYTLWYTLILKPFYGNVVQVRLLDGEDDFMNLERQDNVRQVGPKHIIRTNFWKKHPGSCSRGRRRSSERTGRGGGGANEWGCDRRRGGSEVHQESDAGLWHWWFLSKRSHPLQVEETVWENKIRCEHRFTEKCHDTFITDYFATQVQYLVGFRAVIFVFIGTKVWDKLQEKLPHYLQANGEKIVGVINCDRVTVTCQRWWSNLCFTESYWHGGAL